VAVDHLLTLVTDLVGVVPVRERLEGAPVLALPCLGRLGIRIERPVDQYEHRVRGVAMREGRGFGRHTSDGATGDLEEQCGAAHRIRPEPVGNGAYQVAVDAGD